MDKKSATVTGVFFTMLVLTGLGSFLATRGSRGEEEEKRSIQQNFLPTADSYTYEVKGIANLQNLTAEKKSNIKSLFISDDEFEELDSDTFQGFYNLHTLKILSYSLKNFSIGADNDLQNLKKLDLSICEIFDLPKNLDFLPNLEELILDETLIDENDWVENIFDPIKNATTLKVLSLVDIPFENFPKDIPKSVVSLDISLLKHTSLDIKYLKNLKKLNMGYTALNGHIYLPDSLENLNMYNVLTEFNEDKYNTINSIANLKNLKYLNVGSNTLNNFSVFYNVVLNTEICKNLLELNMSNEYGVLKYIPENAFENCPNLQVLDLSVIHMRTEYTGLNELKSAWFKHSPNLQVVKLFGHGFNCKSDEFEQELEKMKMFKFVLEDSEGNVVFRDQWKEHLCNKKVKESHGHQH